MTSAFLTPFSCMEWNYSLGSLQLFYDTHSIATATWASEVNQLDQNIWIQLNSRSTISAYTTNYSEYSPNWPQLQLISIPEYSQSVINHPTTCISEYSQSVGSTQRQAGQAETISSTKIDAKYRRRGDYGPFMGEGKVLEGYLSFCNTNL